MRAVVILAFSALSIGAADPDRVPAWYGCDELLDIVIVQDADEHWTLIVQCQHELPRLSPGDFRTQKKPRKPGMQRPGSGVDSSGFLARLDVRQSGHGKG